jgi:hypothetical protein
MIAPMANVGMMNDNLAVIKAWSLRDGRAGTIPPALFGWTQVRPQNVGSWTYHGC